MRLPTSPIVRHLARGAALAALTAAAGCTTPAPLTADVPAGNAPPPVAEAPPLPAAEAARIVRATRVHARSVALAWPAAGQVAEPFRPGVNRGIAIAVEAGQPVRAAADGRVMYAGTGLNEYGSLVIVQHNADFLTAYARSRRLLVRTGDVVRRGEPIAEADGTLLHRPDAVLFEVRRDGKPVDPAAYLPARRG